MVSWRRSWLLLRQIGEINFVCQCFLHGATLYESCGHLQFMGMSPVFRKLLVNKHFGLPSALMTLSIPSNRPAAGFLCIDWQHYATADARNWL
jgi:hypothetical protein